MTDIRRILVLGHSGFIGTHVMEQFRRLSPGLAVEGFSYPELDLTEPDAARALLAPRMEASTALVVLSGIKRQLGDTPEIFQKNLQMILTLGRLLEERPVGRVVFVSSGAVYGEEIDNTAIDERTPARPISYYGIAKYASEGLLERACRSGRIPLVSVRPPLVYGPGDESSCYGPVVFARTVLAGKPIVLWGDGDELREFLYVGDLARILHGLVFSTAEGAVNAVTGHSRTFRDVVAALESVAGRKLAVETRARSKQKVDNAYDNARLRNLLPGFVFTSLEEGVRLTFEAERAARSSTRA